MANIGEVIIQENTPLVGPFKGHLGALFLDKVNSSSLSSTSNFILKAVSMPDERDCVVKLVDNHGVEHSVRVRAESVYEAALRGLQQLERVGWESTGEQIGWVTAEYRLVNEQEAKLFDRLLSSACLSSH